jgi:hypothetical protein
MVKFVNRAKMTTSTVGTGLITLGSAVAGFQSFAAAGVANAETVRYAIEDGDAWEIGAGVYSASGTTLSRTVLESSNSDAPLSLSGLAMVFVTAAAVDLAQASSDTPAPLGAATAGASAAYARGDHVHALPTASTFGIRTETASYVLAAADCTVLADATAGAVTITLPSAVASGRVFNIKKMDATANAVILAAAGGDTIDGSSTASIYVQYLTLTVQSFGSGWAII